MATLTLTIASQLQAQGFTEAAAAVRGMGTAADEATTSFAELQESLGAIGALLPAIGLAAFLKSANTEALNAEESQRRLQTEVELTGQSWAKNGAQLNSYLDALSQNSRFLKTDLTVALTDLVQKTGNVTMAQKDLQLAMGLTVAKGGDLADWADKVGIAATTGGRGLLMLQKEFKGVIGNTTDNIVALDRLNAAYGQLALTEQSNTKIQDKFWNEQKSDMEAVGEAIMPTINGIIMLLDNLEKRVILVFSGLNQAIYGLLASWKDLGAGLKKVASAFDIELPEGAKAATKAIDDVAKSAQKLGAVVPGDIKELTAALTELHKKTAALSNEGILDPQQKIKKEVADITAELMKLPGAQQHMEEIRTAIAAYAAAERANLAKEESKKIETALADLIKKNTAMTEKGILDPKDQEKQEVARMIAEFKKLGPSETQLQAYITQAQLYGDHQREAEQKKALQKQSKAYEKYGEDVTNTLIQASTTQHANAAKFLEAQLIMMGAKAAAGILMNYAEGASTQVATQGWIGVASGAALQAAGATAAGAITAFASSAASNLEGGGSLTSPGGGGGGGGGGVSGGTVAGPTQQGITVYVSGDMISEPGYLAKLTRGISDAVQSQNMNLVATTAKF